MLHQIRLFFIALQFFTRLPIPAWVGFEAVWLQQSVRYFVLVGVIMGGITAASYWLFALLWPQTVAVLLSTIVGILTTGAFHEDGFADMCDGFGGGLTPARVLEIMQDSRVGAYGAIGIGLMLALKCALLTSMPEDSVVAALLLAHPLSRLASTSLIWRLQYVRGEGKAKPLAEQMSHGEFLIALVTMALLMLGLFYSQQLPWYALVSGCLAAAWAAISMGRRMWRRLGGYTGDCLGATQQVAEVAIYLALLACLAQR